MIQVKKNELNQFYGIATYASSYWTMEKIITKELFENSYYAIGAGLTLSPLLKMSHFDVHWIKYVSHISFFKMI
jgi:hypothetical protein